MVDDDLELERDIGEATIVYEGIDEDPIEETVPNEHVAHVRNHWVIKTGEDERGRDVVRQIPSYRVYHVDRSVEAFEEEIRTLRDRVQSVADELRALLPVGGEGGEAHSVGVDRSEPYEGGGSNES